jgi:integrase/recombinase XerC
MSLQQFRNYMALEKKYSAHTVEAYLRDLEQFQAFCQGAHGEEPLEDMPYSVIRSWIIAQIEGGCANRSVNRKVASLKAYYKYLVRMGRIAASPLAAHRPLKAEKKVEIPFSVGEMQELLSQWPEEPGYESLRDRLLVDLLYSTGIRRAELIGIHVADLDLNTGTVKVLGKRNKERILPLLTGLAPLCESYLEARETEFPEIDSPYLFLTASGNKMYEALVYRIINKYLSKVSQKAKKSPHVLRHTFATHLLNQGADLNSVKELLGHASLASTQVYTHNSIAELKRIHLESHPRNKKRDTM